MNFELSDEQRLWRNAVHEFCAENVRPMAAEYDERAEIHQEAFEKMAALGLLGLYIPEHLGGADVDAISGARAAIFSKAS